MHRSVRIEPHLTNALKDFSTGLFCPVQLKPFSWKGRLSASMAPCSFHGSCTILSHQRNSTRFAAEKVWCQGNRG